MKATERTGYGSRYLLAFIVAAIAMCLAFGIMAIASGSASAAPESSSSSAELIASSTSEADEAADADAADADAVATIDGDAESVKLPLGNDLFISAQSIDSTGENVKANLFAGGANVTLNDSKVGADAFVAGDVINIASMASSNNIFVAGNNITISGTTGNTLFVAGNNLDIAADAVNMFAAGRTVFLKGTFEGNVSVSAVNVVVDPYIVVNGTLDISASQEPTIASTAKIGTYNFTQEEETDVNFQPGFADIGSPEWIQMLIWTLVGMLVVGLFLLLFLRTETIDATGRLTRNRPVAILVTGILSLILMPILIVALVITVVALPIGVILMSFGVGTVLIAEVYTAIALGRAILGRINKWVSSIIFLLVFGLIMSLPVVNFIVAVLCSIFAFGSMIQGWWVWRRGKELPDSRKEQEDYADFNLPRGEHNAVDQSGTVMNRPYTPSGVGQPVDSPITPDEPRNW